MIEDEDPFTRWCREHDMDPEVPEVFAQYMFETTGFDGQQFSLSEDERNWIDHANEVIEWLRLAVAAQSQQTHDEALGAAFRLVRQLRPIPSSLTVP